MICGNWQDPVDGSTKMIKDTLTSQLFSPGYNRNGIVSIVNLKIECFVVCTV
jgi:hypothetical protein